MSDAKQSQALALIPRSIDESTALAERLAQSSLLPAAMRGKMADVLVTIMAGQEMGLPPMASLRAFHVIEGKPVLGADGMVAIALGSGKCAYFERVEQSDTAVTYETLRVGSKAPQRCTWTIDMAKKAGLHLKDNWRLYPRAMLASRAKAELARDVYSDVLMGCYTDDEIDSRERPAYVAPPKHDAIDADFAEVPAADPPEFAAIDAADSVESLKSQIKAINALPAAAKRIAKERFGAKLAKLEKEESGGVEVVLDAPINGVAS